MGLGDGRGFVIGQQRQKRFCQPRQVPLRDRRLIAIGVAAVLVDGAEDGRRMIGVHEGARAVVDGFSRDRHIVRVHDPMNETDVEPSRDEARLAGDDAFQQRAIGAWGVPCFGVVAGDHVIGQLPHAFGIAPCREELERSHTDMARSHTRENGARDRRVAPHHLAGRHSGKGTGRRHTQSGHRFAHEIFAQDGTERRPPIAAPGKGRRPRALQLDVTALSAPIDDFTQKDCAAVAELRHEVSELMAGIGHRERLASLRHAIACEDGDAVRRRKEIGIESEFLRDAILSRMREGAATGVGESRAKKCAGRRT